MIPSLELGINISSIAMEIPALVAKRKPDCNNRSAKITVSRKPHLRNEVLIKREISFFLSGLLISAKAIPLGKISDKIARPTEVCWTEVFATKRSSPSAVLLTISYSVIRTAIRLATSTIPASYARITSGISAKTMPSPLPLILSRVA